ncbi:MAG: TonB-dependent siderophore receptor [Acidobacteriota bacterium]
MANRRVVFLLGALACCAAHAQVAGTVVDETKAVIPGALVKLERESPRAVLTATTDERGEFAFPNAGAGAWRITVEKPGFETARQRVRAEAGELRVPDIVLAAAAVRTAVTVTEGIGYQLPIVSTATKTPTLVLDIPQSIQPVTRAVIEEQAALSMNDVLRNVSGVSPNLGEGRRDQMLIRGFAATGDQYIDGVRDDAPYYRDLSNIDSVEVVKGPSAVLFGRGSSGGLVNRITKKPESERPVASVRALGGSYGAKRTEVDASMPWLDGKLAGRVNGAYEDSGSHRDFFSLNRYAVSPALLWKPSEATDLLGQFDYLNDERIPDRGIPSLNGAPAPVRAGAYYGYPEDDFIRTHAAAFAATLNHRFESGWAVRDVFRNANYDTGFSNTFPNTTVITGGEPFVTRGQYNAVSGQHNVFNQTEVSGTRGWGGVQNLVLAGFEYGRQSKSTTQFTGTAATVALFNPVLTAPVYSTNPATLNRFTGIVAGFYVQDQISWRRWRLLLGARRDRYEQTQDNLLPGSQDLARTDNAWSPRVGLVYRVVSSVSTYASFTRTFNPSGEGLSLAANNEELKPERTRNLEAGVKTDLFNGVLTASAAVFRLDRTNIKTTDPLNPLQLILVGAQRTDGVEVNLSGKVWRSLNVTGGYAFFDPLIRRSNSLSSGILIEGKVPSLVPKRSGSLWGTYFWQNGFGIGGGVFQASRRFAANDNLVALPGYVRIDAALFYRARRWGATLNLRNLLNRRYYETAYTNAQIYPGAPVNGLLAMHYRW